MAAPKTKKVRIDRGVVYKAEGKAAVDLLPGDAKKPNIVELPAGVADEFIATGHASEVEAEKAAKTEAKSEK